MAGSFYRIASWRKEAEGQLPAWVWPGGGGAAAASWRYPRAAEKMIKTSRQSVPPHPASSPSDGWLGAGKACQRGQTNTPKIAPHTLPMLMTHETAGFLS